MPAEFRSPTTETRRSCGKYYFAGRPPQQQLGQPPLGTGAEERNRRWQGPVVAFGTPRSRAHVRFLHGADRRRGVSPGKGAHAARRAAGVTDATRCALKAVLTRRPRVVTSIRAARRARRSSTASRPTHADRHRDPHHSTTAITCGYRRLVAGRRADCREEGRPIPRRRSAGTRRCAFKVAGTWALPTATRRASSTSRRSGRRSCRLW